jgi:hypothetical protein
MLRRALLKLEVGQTAFATQVREGMCRLRVVAEQHAFGGETLGCGLKVPALVIVRMPSVVDEHADVIGEGQDFGQPLARG